MKVYNKNSKTTWFLFLYVTMFILVIASCKSEEEAVPTEQDRIRGLLTSGVWKIQSVTVDEVDQTSLFVGLTLKFSAQTFTATNGEPVWPSSGTWRFIDQELTRFLRDDDITVTILESSESVLKLGLRWNKTTVGNGRAQSVEGDHVFAFVK